MQEFKNARRVVVKVGTSTLTYETGRINIRRLEGLVKVLADLANSGLELTLVTSGAIGVGAGKLGLRQRPKKTSLRQAAAAVGQCELMHLYDQCFSRFNHTVAQILFTKDVVDDPHRRQNVVNTFAELFELGVIPIINENDTVATDELEGECFGDNDSLSAIIATLVNADALVILSDIDGLYTANPHVSPDAKLIPVVERIDDTIWTYASGSKSNRGTGGMTTKIHAAQIAVRAGVCTAIINGQNPKSIYELLEGKQIGTVFKPELKPEE